MPGCNLKHAQKVFANAITNGKGNIRSKMTWKCKLLNHKWINSDFVEWQKDKHYGNGGWGSETVSSPLSRKCKRCGIEQRRKYWIEQDGHIGGMCDWKNMAEKTGEEQDDKK